MLENKLVTGVSRELHKYSGANRGSGKKYMGWVDAEHITKHYPDMIDPIYLVIVYWDYGIARDGEDNVTIDKTKKIENRFKTQQEQMQAFMLLAKHLKMFKEDNNVREFILGDRINFWDKKQYEPTN